MRKSFARRLLSLVLVLGLVLGSVQTVWADDKENDVAPRWMTCHFEIK